MLGRLRRHVTFANVVASICLFVVLGGTSFASDTARNVTAFASKLITGKNAGQTMASCAREVQSAGSMLQRVAQQAAPKKT